MGDSLAKTLAGAASCDLGFQAPALSRLEIKGMLLGVGDDSFARNLPLKATDRAFDAFVIVNLYLSHSQPPIHFTEVKSLHNALRECQSDERTLETSRTLVLSMTSQ